MSIEGATGPVDIWHYDSVAYTGVVLLSDVQSMVGGKLEFAHVDKHKGLDLLAQGKPFKSEIIGMYSKVPIISTGPIIRTVLIFLGALQL